ncbi:MAG: hypothetical protein ACRD5E_09030, partial [Nitrososphaeraceae archaeon]
TFNGAQMPIVVGPNIDLAIGLIRRIRNMFEPLGILFNEEKTIATINGCRIESFPSNHLDAYRSLVNPKFIFLDEADFFRPDQQQDARDVAERYIAKSNPWIVMVSTPNAPDGLFDRIQKEPEESCLYKRLFLDYTYRSNKIYKTNEIRSAKMSPSFEREYNLKYLGIIGNVFHIEDIERAITKGETTVNPNEIHDFTQKSMGIDPGFGTTGVCITEYIDNQISVVHAEEYTRLDFNDMIDIVLNLMDKYNLFQENNCSIYIDAANNSFIRRLKQMTGDSTQYEQQIAQLKTTWKNKFSIKMLRNSMFIVPVPFNSEHKTMLSHCQEALEYSDGSVAIHSKYDKLIVSLRTATEKAEMILDKDATSYQHVFDAFRLSLQYYQ